jgi:hypothetical protein
MSDKPLFENMDEQERTYANEDPERVAADEQSPLGPPRSEEGDTPVAIPVGTGGTSVPATPPSDAYEPGMDREEHDIVRDEEGYVGPDMRDEQVKPSGSATQGEPRRTV